MTEALNPDMERALEDAREPATYPIPEHGWVCFHCGEHFPGTFAGSRAAREHFGWKPDAAVACIIKGEDGGLLRKLRGHIEGWRKAEDEWRVIRAALEAQVATLREALDNLDFHASPFVSGSAGSSQPDLLRMSLERARTALNTVDGDRT